MYQHFRKDRIRKTGVTWSRSKTDPQCISIVNIQNSHVTLVSNQECVFLCYIVTKTSRLTHRLNLMLLRIYFPFFVFVRYSKQLLFSNSVSNKIVVNSVVGRRSFRLRDMSFGVSLT